MGVNCERAQHSVVEGLPVRIPLRPCHCRCVLGQDTSPTLPGMNVSECLVVVGGIVGAIWQPRLCLKNGFCMRFEMTLCYERRYIVQAIIIITKSCYSLLLYH